MLLKSNPSSTGMNRYESAYRDYTIPRAGGDESSLYPQRPERTVKTTGAAGRFITRGHANEVSSDETSDSYERRMIQNHNQASGFSTDEESFANIQQNPRQIVSSRELSDRNNPDFLVPNDAIQTYRQHLQQRSPSLLDESGSEERESRQMPSQQQLEEDDERYYEHNNGNQQHHHYRRQDEEQVEDLGPEIFIPQPEFFTRMPTSELSQGSYRTYRTAPPYTEDATMRSKTSKRGGIVVETSRAPHPLCPNTRSCCCLLLLFNLGLLLICLGFVIVLQLNDPPFVWYLGVFMLVFGFVSIIVGLIFCAWMCREGSPDAPLPPNSELYWTHHWRKTIYMPEHHGRVHETHVKVPIGDEEIHYVDDGSDSYTSGQPAHNMQHEPNQRYHNNNNNNNSARY